MKRLLQWLFGKNTEPAKMDPVPPRPADWNKTIDDLMQEMNAGLRKEIRHPELDWAREYTRSLIPDGLRYPRQGDVYESLVDQPIRYMTAWRAPYTGGGDSKILAGERVWIDDEPTDEKPIGVYAMPIEYDKLETRMVPEEERSAAKYNGFYLSIDTMVLLEKFNLVETNHRPKETSDVRCHSRQLTGSVTCGGDCQRLRMLIGIDARGAIAHA